MKIRLPFVPGLYNFQIITYLLHLLWDTISEIIKHLKDTYILIQNEITGSTYIHNFGTAPKTSSVNNVFSFPLRTAHS